MGFSGGPVVKNLPANVGDARDAASIPGSGRSPRGGNGNPLQYSCLEYFMDRGAWWATFQGVKESNTTEHSTQHIHELQKIRIYTSLQESLLYLQYFESVLHIARFKF